MPCTCSFKCETVPHLLCAYNKLAGSTASFLLWGGPLCEAFCESLSQPRNLWMLCSFKEHSVCRRPLGSRNMRCVHVSDSNRMFCGISWDGRAAEGSSDTCPEGGRVMLSPQPLVWGQEGSRRRVGREL